MWCPGSSTSLSARRAWIEIVVPIDGGGNPPGSLSARRAWIEMAAGTTGILRIESLSARRAWIEILGTAIL